MELDQAKKIISAYIENVALERDIDDLSLWLKDKSNQELIKKFLSERVATNLKEKSFDHSEAYTSFLSQTQGLILSSTPKPKEKRFKSLLKYAALIILLISLNALLKPNSTTGTTLGLIDNNEVILTIDGNKRNIGLEETGTVKTKKGYEIAKINKGVLQYGNTSDNAFLSKSNILNVPKGKRFKVKLADGTLVSLNSGSKLTYPTSFSAEEERVVYLKGEAFFEVSKSNKPFIVQTYTLETKVYGTEFNVSSYENENLSAVVLVEGSVGVKKKESLNNEYTVITPSQKLTRQVNSLKFTVEQVDVSKYTAWKKGILTFENENLQKILNTLERHFNIEIQNNYKALNSKIFTGTFETETLTDILKIIVAHTHFTFDKNENKISINESKLN